MGGKYYKIEDVRGGKLSWRLRYFIGPSMFPSYLGSTTVRLLNE